MSGKRHLLLCVACVVAATVRGEPRATAGGGDRDTIVPAPDRIDDATTRLLYAQSLSYRRETWPQAVTAFERILQTSPGEPQATAGLARLYLWMNRPHDAAALLAAAGHDRPLTDDETLVAAEAQARSGALAALRALLARTPHPSAELLTATASASVAAGDIAGARALYERALQGAPDSAEARRGYALTLAWSGEAEAALPRLERLLDQPAGAAGGDPDVAHAYAEALAQLDGTDAAIDAVRRRAGAAPASAAWRAEWADLEARRGHAVRARALFAEALARENTPAMRLRAGRAAVTWGDFNGAERALREALARTPDNAQLRDDLGRLLVSADRFEEAEQWYRQWLADAPESEAARLGFARLALKEKDFVTAVARAQAAERAPASAETQTAARAIEADALAGAQRWKEAVAMEAAVADAAGPDDAGQRRRATAELALARIEARANAAAAVTTAAGSAESSRSARAAAIAAAQQAAPDEPAVQFAVAGAQAHTAAFRRNLTTDETSAPRLVTWAGEYAATGDYHSAIACLRAARAADPEYYPAQSELAEFLAIDGQYEAALRDYAALKQAMPGNRQVLLGEARTLAWARRYDAALSAYAALAALNPADPVPRREAARTANWAKERRRSADLYATAWTPQPVDAALATGLRAVLPDDATDPTVRRWAAWAANPPRTDEPFAATARFYREEAPLGSALPAAPRAALERLGLSLQAQFRIQRAWWWENEAKQAAWDRRYATAAKDDRRLLAVEPGNEEAWFDLSQAEAAQGLGRAERAALTQLLVLDPNHTLARSAARRRDLRSAPRADVEGRYWHERGRGDLSSLERTALAATAQAMGDDQYQVRAGAELGRESPLTRHAAYAYRAADFSTSGVFSPEWSGSAAFQHREYYDSRIGHSDTGEAQLWFKHDADGVGVGYERRDEGANEWALFQGTQSDNVWLGGTAALARRVDLDARLTDTAYNDANRGVGVVIRPAYAWTDHPRVFKTLLTLEYRDTREASRYFRDPAGRLVNLVHPYWTPQAYTHAALTLEWFHDLARQYFVGSEANDYDVRLTFGTDSESNPAATLEADWHREWRDRWVAHASLYVNRSREWNATGLQLQLGRRF